MSRLPRRTPPPSYECITEGVRILVRPKFLHDESDPPRARYVWAYTVEVENHSSETWTIMRRHWRIVDAAGRVQFVDGEGVVGQTPTLAPGERFSYSSGAPLATPSGMMSGTYDLESPNGRELVAAIPAFSLDSPYETSRPS